MNAWLKENDLSATPLTDAGDWLSVDVPVTKANELLDADFAVFTHPETRKQAVRTLSYSIPGDLREHIALVHPTIRQAYLLLFAYEFQSLTRLFRISFPHPKGNRAVMHSASAVNSTRRASQAGACSSSGITPACAQQLYNIPSTPATESSNQLAVSGFIKQYANQADLTVCC